MIASIRGTVIHKEGFSVVVECSGLGWELLLTRAAADACEVGSDAFLYVHMQISESGFALFGFASPAERTIFRLIMLTKGVGGKVSISLLQHLSVTEIISALERSDMGVLTSVPGIGKKTAERICFELQGRIAKSGLSGLITGGDGLSSSASGAAGLEAGVIEALESLGFDHVSCLRAYKTLMSAPENEKLNESDAIMGCLKILQPRPR